MILWNWWFYVTRLNCIFFLLIFIRLHTFFIAIIFPLIKTSVIAIITFFYITIISSVILHRRNYHYCQYYYSHSLSTSLQKLATVSQYAQNETNTSTFFFPAHTLFFFFSTAYSGVVGGFEPTLFKLRGAVISYFPSLPFTACRGGKGAPGMQVLAGTWTASYTFTWEFFSPRIFCMHNALSCYDVLQLTGN